MHTCHLCLSVEISFGLTLSSDFWPMGCGHEWKDIEGQWKDIILCLQDKLLHPLYWVTTSSPPSQRQWASSAFPLSPKQVWRPHLAGGQTPECGKTSRGICDNNSFKELISSPSASLSNPPCLWGRVFLVVSLPPFFSSQNATLLLTGAHYPRV